MNKSLALTDRQYDYLVKMRSRATDPVLDNLRRETMALGDGVSTMIASAEQGDFFTLLVAALRVESALEVGVFTGFSSLSIARGLPPHGKLLCLDVSDEWTAIGRKYWAQAGLSDKIELILGPAAESLRRLDPARTFDFVFIDADKPGYDAYYELVLPKLRPNGLILFDNMLSHGNVLSPSNEREKALDALNRKLAVDSRVECVLLPIADGVMFCRKK
jgi:caffeoyl-CoA O-methyltransferase